MTASKTWSFFEALVTLMDECVLTNSDADQTWLEAVFGGRNQQQSETTVRAALIARADNSNRRANLRLAK